MDRQVRHSKKTKPLSAQAERRAVLVMGMHRSGTSALTAVLGFLGCDLPEALMKPAPENEMGFFESDRITALNEALLAAVGLSWFDWTPISAEGFEILATDQFRSQAREVLQQDFNSSPLFVIKDPRVCRLTPFWLDTLEDMGCQPLIVHTFRSPVEVAASLARAQKREPSASHLLWLSHVLDAEAHTRGRGRMFTNYDMLMSDWSHIPKQFKTTFGTELPRVTEQAAADIEAFLTPRLRHFLTDGDELSDLAALPVWLQTTYAVLKKWAQKGEDSEDYATLDAIRSLFDQATRNFQPLAQAAQTLHARVTHLELSVGQLTDDLEDRQEKLNRGLSAQATLQQQLENENEALSQSQSAIQSITESRDAAQQQHVKEHAQLAADLLQRGREIATLQQQLEQENEALSQSQSALQSITESRDAAQQQHVKEQAQLAADLLQRGREIAALQQQLEHENEALSQRQSALQSITESRDAAQQQHVKEQAQLAADLLQRGQEIAALQKHQAANQASIGALLKIDAQRQQQLTEAGAKARQDGTAISRLNEYVAQLETDTQTQQVTLQAQLEKSEALTNDLASRTTHWAQEKSHFERHIAALQQQRTDLLQSTSWKITSPLRGVFRLFIRRSNRS